MKFRRGTIIFPKELKSFSSSSDNLFFMLFHSPTDNQKKMINEYRLKLMNVLDIKDHIARW